jgi:hypothetical protein
LFMKHRSNIRGMRNTALSTLAFLALGAMASAAPHDPTARYYAATISPTSVNAGSLTTFTMTFTNCGSTTATVCNGLETNNNQTFKSASVTVPSGFIVDGSSLGLSATGGKSWAGSLSGNTIILGAVNGNDGIDIGESLTLTFNATAPCNNNSTYTWTTVAYQDALSGGALVTTTPFTLANTQPTVEVTGSCVQQQLTGYCTSSQGGWGADAHGGNTGAILASSFGIVYPSGVTVGGTYTMTFTSASAVNSYLPAGGTPGTLSADYIDPTSTSSGVFGAQVLTLQLNLGLQSYLPGFVNSIDSLKLSGTGTSLDGSTVSQIEAAAQTALGGGALPSGYTISSLESLVDQLNNAFEENCTASDWANAHLVE